MYVSTPTGRWGPCCSTAATGRTAMARLMSRVRKSSVVRSSQKRAGISNSSWSIYPGRDRFDLHLEFRPGETRHDHQGRGRRRRTHMPVADLHIGLQVRSVGYEGVD